jgi:hypothetical protein
MGTYWHVYPPNPILLAYREHITKHRLTTDAEAWVFALDAFDAFGGYVTWNEPTNHRHAIITASDSERAHAREVLSRLARIAAVR